MLIGTLIGHTILPAYTLIGFIPGVPLGSYRSYCACNDTYLACINQGLKNVWELYFFAAFYGFNIGAAQSFSRALFMNLVPPGHESEFFGFYELFDVR